VVTAVVTICACWVASSTISPTASTIESAVVMESIKELSP